MLRWRRLRLPGAFETIAALLRATGGRVWLVSKAGPRVAERTRRWLAHHRFFERTRLDPEHLRFCRARADKAVHARELSLSHFVDDRLDVLVHLCPFVPRLVLFGSERAPSWAAAAPSWKEVPRALGLEFALTLRETTGTRTAPAP